MVRPLPPGNNQFRVAEKRAKNEHESFETFRSVFESRALIQLMGCRQVWINQCSRRPNHFSQIPSRLCYQLLRMFRRYHNDGRQFPKLG